MDLGKKVYSIKKTRHVSFDGSCYHVRIPLEIIRFLKEKKIDVDKVGIKGIWQTKEKSCDLILIFEKPTGNILKTVRKRLGI